MEEDAAEAAAALAARITAIGARTSTTMATYVQGSNGDAVYTNARAMMGRIDAGMFMMIPETMSNMVTGAITMDIDLVNFGSTDGVNSMIGATGRTYAATVPYFNYSAIARTDDEKIFDAAKMSALNFATLTAAGLSPIAALYVASLRTRWAMTGGLKALVSDTSTTDVEHVIVSATDSTYGNLSAAATASDLNTASVAIFEAYLDVVDANPDAGAWVVYHAEAIWSAVEFVFRTRGHHFKTSRSESSSYEAIYKRYLSASFEGTFEWPAALEMFSVFHTAIHPFKIRALAVVTAHYLAHGKLSESAKLRLHSAPCGHAMITTAVAALATMKGEVWWSAFERSFETTIAQVTAYASQINGNRYAYHQAAGLYGIDSATTVLNPKDRSVVSMADAKVQVKFICAACQGLIQALNEAVRNKAIAGFSLSNSQALAKAAGDAPLLTMRISGMIYKSLTMAEDAITLTDLIKTALPEHAAAIQASPVE